MMIVKMVMREMGFAINAPLIIDWASIQKFMWGRPKLFPTMMEFRGTGDN